MATRLHRRGQAARRQRGDWLGARPRARGGARPGRAARARACVASCAVTAGRMPGQASGKSAYTTDFRHSPSCARTSGGARTMPSSRLSRTAALSTSGIGLAAPPAAPDLASPHFT